MIRASIVCVLALCLAIPAIPAPAPKETQKPLPPATPAMKQTSENHLKLIGLAMHGYHDVQGALPSNLLTKEGKPGLSWRVAILPFLDQQDELYKQFKLDEPWDSENNLKLADAIPKIYFPIRGRAEKGQTFYQMFAGKSTLLDPSGKGISLAAVTDGLSNTFMVVEGAKPVIWTKPDDLPFDGKEVPKLGGMFDGEFHALFGDGAVRRLPKGLDADVLKALIDRQDGQVIDLDGAIKKAEGKE